MASAAATLRPGLMKEGELREQSQRFLSLFRAGLQGMDGALDIDALAWSEVRELLRERSPEGVFWDWPGDTELVIATKN